MQHGATGAAGAPTRGPQHSHSLGPIARADTDGRGGEDIAALQFDVSTVRKSIGALGRDVAVDPHPADALDVQRAATARSCAQLDPVKRDVAARREK